MQMLKPRRVLTSALLLFLLGCASVPPDGNGAIARISPEDLARILPKPEPKLPPAELVRLSREGAAAQDIIAKIKQSGSTYALSASELIQLHDQGVSVEVLDYIQSAREQALRASLAEEINQREQRHAEELQREQEQLRNSYFYDPWWPGYPGWRFGYPYGGYYWRR